MTTKFKETDRFTLREDLVVEEVDDEVIVLDLAGNKYFGLNQVAWLIWRAIDEGGQSIGSIANSIVESFGISEDAALADVEVFVGELVHAGLATRLEGESTR